MVTYLEVAKHNNSVKESLGNHQAEHTERCPGAQKDIKWSEWIDGQVLYGVCSIFKLPENYENKKINRLKATPSKKAQD